MTHASLTPVAQYIRMSTEQQRYSADNQAAAIELYAAARGYEVVQTYADLGKSGVTIARRTALQQLLADVERGQVNFKAVLVYDVSRWGRFPDPDEAAAYESACKRAGIAVHYCADGFDNDGSAAASIMKSIKRIMAAEFSRDLSEKTYAHQRRAASLGFLTHRWIPLGLRRMLIDHRGHPVRVLGAGERNVRGCRVTFVPGPKHEVALVNRIFRLFGKRGWTLQRIANRLNHEGIRNPLALALDQRWTYQSVSRLRRCEAYIGTSVVGKTTMRMGRRQRRVPRSAWARTEGVYEPIVSRGLFDAVQRRIARADRKTDAEMLADLRTLHETYGCVNSQLLRAHPQMSRGTTYAARFGSLAEAYRLAGYEPKSAVQASTLGQGTQKRRSLLICDVADILRAADGDCTIDWRRGRLRTGRGFVIDVRACIPSYNPRRNWVHRTTETAKPPLTLIARLGDDLEPEDYCLVTAAGFRGIAGIYLPASMRERAGVRIFKTLDGLHARGLQMLAEAEEARLQSALTDPMVWDRPSTLPLDQAFSCARRRRFSPMARRR